jgi:hypothetical protein
MKVDSLQTNFTPIYKAQPWTNFTVNGIVTGIYKNAGTFTYLRVYGAGHEASHIFLHRNLTSLILL